MAVFVGLINTRVIKASEIAGRIALTMTRSQKDRSLPAKRKYIWWEETDVTQAQRCKGETPRDCGLQSSGDTTRVGQTQPVDSTTVNSPPAPTDVLEDLSEVAESLKQYH